MQTKTLILITLLGFNFSILSSQNTQAIDYAALLGKEMGSTEIKNFLATLKGPKEIENSGEYPHWMYLQDGVEFVVTKTNKVYAIFFVQKSASYQTAFKGYLPNDLKMTDSRADVEKKMGKGEVNSFYPGINESYKNKKMQIDFEKDDMIDMKNKVTSIQFRTWE